MFDERDDGLFDELREHLAASRQHLDEIARAMRHTSGSQGILETATITIPATGYTERSYRVPYAALAVLNLALSSTVIITSAAAQNSAPGGGQGQIQVPPGGAIAQNMTGQAITFYAAEGTVITYCVLTSRIQPTLSAAAVTALAYSGTSISATGSLTAPTAYQPFVSTPVLPAGTYDVEAYGYFSGAAPAASDADNMQVADSNSNLICKMLAPPADNVLGPPARFRYIAPGGLFLKMRGPVAGTASVVYHGSIIATQVA